MPNIKSAKKRVKTSEKKRIVNKSAKSAISTIRVKLYKSIADGNKDECVGLMRKYSSLLDKAVKKGTIKANAASRRKSRAAVRLAAIS